MKKSYIKLLILELVLFITILFNDFVINKLTNYLLICLLLLCFLVLRLMLGREKGRFRNTKEITALVAVYSIVYLSITYLGGIFISFSKSADYWTLSGIVKYVMPVLINIIVVEILRDGIIQKSKGSKLLIISTTLLFVFVDVVLKIDADTFSSAYNFLMFCAYYLLPSIAKNILCVMLCYKTGYTPSIIYRIITEMYAYFLPIYPDFGEYINSVLRLILPSILAFIVAKRVKNDLKVDIKAKSNIKLDRIKYGIATIAILILVYFTSGIFSYYALAIGSGSMVPKLHKGDIVIIKKLSNEEKYNVKKGQILAHKYGNTVIVHRINDIYKDDDDFYVYTKGDANEKQDGYPINTVMMIGIVKLDIPLIGYPTVWLSNNIK